MADDRNYDFPSSSYGRDREDEGRDYGSGRDYSYSSAREFQAAGELGGGREDRNFRGGGTGPGGQFNRPSNYGGRESYGRDFSGRDYYGGREVGAPRGQGQPYYGSYAHDGLRFDETSRDPNRDYRGERSGNRGGYGRQPEGYNYQDRGFVARAGDEVRSWFGDEDAERRREYDQRYDERTYGTTRGQNWSSPHASDRDYHNWRRSQIDALDRDYHEYRTENAEKFENDFGSWRSNRQTQRSALDRVSEHMEVLGSDGGHVGTVDKVRGDRIILTKNDEDAGGRHHSIPSSWIQSVDDKVTIAKAADDAKKHWRDEERSSAFFGSDRDATPETDGSVNLNRSFSGTY